MSSDWSKNLTQDVLLSRGLTRDDVPALVEAFSAESFKSNKPPFAQRRETDAEEVTKRVPMLLRTTSSLLFARHMEKT